MCFHRSSPGTSCSPRSNTQTIAMVFHCYPHARHGAHLFLSSRRTPITPLVGADADDRARLCWCSARRINEDMSDRAGSRGRGSSMSPWQVLAVVISWALLVSAAWGVVLIPSGGVTAGGTRVFVVSDARESAAALLCPRAPASHVRTRAALGPPAPNCSFDGVVAAAAYVNATSVACVAPAARAGPGPACFLLVNGPAAMSAAAAGCNATFAYYTRPNCSSMFPAVASE
jgi:hypothetical protein